MSIQQALIELLFILAPIGVIRGLLETNRKDGP